MSNASVRDLVVEKLLPYVKTPGQYAGGEPNCVVKNHDQVQASCCFAFPDTYTLGMSHHGMHLLYNLVNQQPHLLCERAFTPFPDAEAVFRANDIPLYGLESFTPLHQFDVLGFTLQYEVCYTNVLTMLDLGKIPLHATDRTDEHPLVIAGGPGAQNPEPLAPFIDIFVVGDGEETLLHILNEWARLKSSSLSRADKIAEIVNGVNWAYAPQFYVPEYNAEGNLAALHRTRPDVPLEMKAAVITQDFDEIPLPTNPVIPLVEVSQDRIAIEIMRGCPWQCRFCQSTVIKRPLRTRSVENIVKSALETYENTGYDEISILSLSSSDYPHFEELVNRLHEVFDPLGVGVSVPSLRVNEQFKSLPKLMRGVRKGGLTLAPEVARDDMRTQIRKPINNDNLFEGCRLAFREGWRRVKLYFMCGLPGERTVDLDGIVDLAEQIARIGKEETGKYIPVTASVSNFVPKPHTPYQWNGMRKREYFQWAHNYMKQRCQLRCVSIKCHDIERSMLEGVLTRGDRRIADAFLEAWRRGARLDAWHEYFDADIWWSTFADLGIDIDSFAHRDRPVDELLPWDHINVKKGREYLAKEQNRSVVQLSEMANAK